MTTDFIFESGPRRETLIHPGHREASRWLHETAPAGALFLGDARACDRKTFRHVLKSIIGSGFSYSVGKPALERAMAHVPAPRPRNRRVDPVTDKKDLIGSLRERVAAGPGDGIEVDDVLAAPYPKSDLPPYEKPHVPVYEHRKGEPTCYHGMGPTCPMCSGRLPVPPA